MKLQGKKIGILIESDYYEKEIFYYELRFAEEGVDLHFLTRLWGQPSLTFSGHDYKIPFECHESFEDMDDATLRSFSAIIVPSAMVADRLRYTEDINKLPPATEFLKRAFAEKSILKGIICHGLWLVAPAPELVRGRRVVAHNNLLGDVCNMGAIYTDQDIVVAGDLVTARTGGHCHLFAHTIIDMLEADWTGECPVPTDGGIGQGNAHRLQQNRVGTGSALQPLSACEPTRTVCTGYGGQGP